MLFFLETTINYLVVLCTYKIVLVVWCLDSFFVGFHYKFPPNNYNLLLMNYKGKETILYFSCDYFFLVEWYGRQHDKGPYMYTTMPYTHHIPVKNSHFW